MNGKSLLISILFLYTLLNGCIDTTSENYFTGTIEYAYSYSSDSLNTDSLIRIRPAKSFFRYDTIAYQSRFIGTDTATYYYDGTLNKCVS